MKRLLLSALVALAAIACGKQPDPEHVALGVPQNVKLHTATETSLTFQWDPVEGAEGYAWRLNKDGSPYKEGTAAKRNVTISGLEKATTYKFSVCATAGSANADVTNSEYSAEIEGATTGEPETPPEPGTENVCVDAPIVLQFEQTPTLGTSGQIRIMDASGKEADSIDLADMSTVTVRESDGAMIPNAQITAETPFNTFMDALHCGRYRMVHYTPLRVEGNKLIINLHSEVLDFGKTYSLVMDAGVVQGHSGIAKGEYEFTTAAAPSKTEIRVAADGSGDFCTIQRALSDAAEGATISIAPGTYREMLYMRDKKDISIKGDMVSAVKIVYPNNESYEAGTGAASNAKPVLGRAIGTSGGRGLFLIENCDNLLLDNLTIENSFGEQKGQAEAIYFNSGNNTHRLSITNSSLLSWQDTFLVKGRVWVYNSHIDGHVDYIWGYPAACLFENCEIRSRGAGYIVQARVPNATDKGFVFLNCSFRSEDHVADGSVYLARSGGSTDYYDNVVFINCMMSPVIAKAGWYSTPVPNPSTPTVTCGWREYRCVDISGNIITGHNAYGKVLTAEQAAPYMTRDAVLGW